MRSRRLALAAACSVAMFGALPARSQDTTVVRIGITYDPGTKPGVLVLKVNGAAGDSIRTILQRDFTNGDRINVIAADGTGFPDVPTAGRDGNYPVFQKLGAQALVQGSVTAAGLHVAVHDVAKGAVLRVKDFALAGAPLSSEWRMAVHAASDELEQWLTGTRGIAATRIAFTREKRIWLIDSDGANPAPVSEGGSALSPNWHPSGKYLTYAVSTGTSWRIAVREIGAGQRWLASTPTGTNISPVFSPDGSSILYAHGEDFGTDLFAAPAFESGPTRRVTVGRGIDNVSPTYSNDGRRIAFTSGRLGHAEVYISDADGTNPDLLIQFKYGDQSYRSDPDWSPDGRTIAFQSQIDGLFQIMTIGLRGRNVKAHTSDGKNENPSWAPDSRHLVFSSTRTGVQQLFVLDTESGTVRQLTHDGGARLPAWSPLLAGR